MDAESEARTPVRFDSLTSIRFFAAFAVAVHHSLAPFLLWGSSGLTSFLGHLGWLGVSFFFILSGFVLMWGFNPDRSYGQFVLRRLVRIWPLHIATLLISIAAWLTVGSALAGWVGTKLATVLNFFLLQNWIPLQPRIAQSWNGVSWTLSCELFFYLCAPLLFPFLLRRWRQARIVVPAIWLLLLVISVVGASQDWGPLLDTMQMSPVFRLFEFIIGAVLAIELRRRTFRFGKPAALFCLFVPILVFTYFFPESSGLRVQPTMIYLVVPGAALLIYATASSDLSGKTSWLQHPRLVYLGDASYSLYMTHALLLGAFSLALMPVFGDMLQPAVPGELMRATYLLSAVLVSCLFYSLFEKPTRSYLMRRLAGVWAPQGSVSKT